jgi:hypothetical protein
MNDGNFVAAALEIERSDIGVLALMHIAHGWVSVTCTCLFGWQSLFWRKGLDFFATTRTKQQSV